MKLPRVSANFALSIDGKTAARGKRASLITSARDRRCMLGLRADADAILVDGATLESDGLPGFSPSRALRARRIRAGKTAEPLRVVFCNSGLSRPNLRIFRDGPPVAIFTTKSMPAATRRRFEKIAFVHVEPRGKKVDLRRALAVLARVYGVRSALCEGGAGLFRSLVLAGLVERLHITIAPVVIGGADAPTLLGPARSSLLRRSIPLTLEAFHQSGSEALATYSFAKPKRRGVSQRRRVP